MADKKNKVVRDRADSNNFLSECRDNTITVEGRLSPNMRRIYRSNFDRLSRAVYFMRLNARRLRVDGLEKKLAEEVMGLINHSNETFKNKISAANIILNKGNINGSHREFDKYNITIIDPLANHYLESILKAQELEGKLSSLWLAMVLDDQQKSRALSEMEDGLHEVMRSVRTLSIGVKNRYWEQRTANESRNAIDANAPDTHDSLSGQVTLATEVDDVDKGMPIEASIKKLKKTSKITDAADDFERLDKETISEVTAAA
jgi:hypothetical protein